MRSISDVTLNVDGSVASAGAGALWGDVCHEMDALDLTVVGGRGSSIGIGGLLTGGTSQDAIPLMLALAPRSLTRCEGGISYFSSRYRFACDNVVNYQVVLASGAIVSANATSNKDLFLALKGGGINFGLVTRFDFDLAAFLQGRFWGGTILYDDSASPQLLKAFADLNKDVVELLLRASHGVVRLLCKHRVYKARCEPVYIPRLYYSSQLDLNYRIRCDYRTSQISRLNSYNSGQVDVGEPSTFRVHY